LQGVDRHEGREFRLRRVPWTRHSACQLRDWWSLAEGAHGIRLGAGTWRARAQSCAS
jgi:hypothetical protein